MRRYLFLLLFSLSNHNTSMTERNLSLFQSIRNEHFKLYIYWIHAFPDLQYWIFCSVPLKDTVDAGMWEWKIHCLLPAVSERDQIWCSYSFYAYHSSRQFLSSFSVLPCYFLLYFTDFCKNVKYFSVLSLYFLFNPLLSLLFSYYLRSVFIHIYAYFMYIFVFICIKITFLKVFSFYYCINIKNGV